MSHHDDTKPEDEHAPTPLPNDPLPNPEPSVPSLDQPDPGVFHHDPAKPQQARESFIATSRPASRTAIHLL
jgi:hypothetical protein